MVWPALRNYSDAATAKTAAVAAACDTRKSKKKCLGSENDARLGDTCGQTFRNELRNQCNIFVAMNHVALALESGKK